MAARVISQSTRSANKVLERTGETLFGVYRSVARRLAPVASRRARHLTAISHFHPLILFSLVATLIVFATKHRRHILLLLLLLPTHSISSAPFVSSERVVTTRP